MGEIKNQTRRITTERVVDQHVFGGDPESRPRTFAWFRGEKNDALPVVKIKVLVKNLLCHLSIYVRKFQGKF